MSGTGDLPDRIDRFLGRRLAGGDDGKTFLLGLHGNACVFAIAAGLRDERDHPGFVTFARYLLHQRFACDGHALMLPAAVGSVPVYAIECAPHGIATTWLLSGDGSRRTWSGNAPLIAELGARGDALPGIQRREMDRLYASLEVPLT